MYLRNNCYLVNGYHNSAIYDLNNRKVYSVNKSGRNLLEKYLKHDKIVEDKDDKEFIALLTKYGLITENKDESDNTDNINKVEPQLKYAWLEITGKCNLKCVHCYGQFGANHVKNKDYLSTEEWKTIIDTLIKNNCREIQLIGGEPMVHKDFYEILKYAYKKGMKRIDVFTNATLINEESIKIFKETNANVRISLYGSNQETHEKITKTKGSFNKTERALKLLRDNNIKTNIAVVIMKENENNISEIREYINLLGLEYSGYDVIRPSCVMNNQEHMVTNYDTIKSRYNVAPEFYTCEESFYSNHFYNSCWNGKIAITANGDIIPCIFARNDIIGNVKDVSSLEKLKKNIIKKWSITKEEVMVCKDCEFRYCCHDCRPLAEGVAGNKKAKYPRCCYNPYDGEWMDIKECTKEVKI